MNTDKAQLEKAFADSDAIMALEGFSGSQKVADLQKQVIDGKLTIDQAVQLAIKQAKAKVGGRSTDS